MNPLCFVLMPFGRKPTGDGRFIDFDLVYEQIIKPAILAANLDPLRADEEIVGGIIHKPMFERLILCPYAVADLTNANMNVYYELGVRHAVRSATTQLLFADGWGPVPFDINLLRALPYKLAADGAPSDASGDAAALTAKLIAAQHQATDSPLFQLVEDFPDIQRLRTDVFRDRVRYAEDRKRQLAAARKAGVAALRVVETDLGDIPNADAAVVVDLFLSYRAVKAWQEMIELVSRMASPLAKTLMVQEQLAWALNWLGRGEEAEQILLALIRQRGASSETNGILGRVYKDRWKLAKEAGQNALARGLLNKAIEAYLQGFESDWRDAYPGINAVTLMEMKDPPDPRQAQLLPIVTYAVQRRVVQGKPDYWDYATLLELAVLSRDQGAAQTALDSALSLVREAWEPESTCRTLGMIRSGRSNRGEDQDWVAQIEADLLGQAKFMQPPASSAPD